MSIRVMSWVLDNSDAPGNDRLVLIAIADEADDDGCNAYPSIDRIARRARVNKRTTMRSLDRLETSNELVIVRPETVGRGRHNRYGVVMGRDVDVVRQLMSDREKGVNLSPGDRREKARKGAPMSAPDPLTPRPASAGADAVSSMIDESSKSSIIEALCDHLADRIEAHREGTDRPIVTERWRRDMRLLLERGPLHVDGAEPQPPDKVRASIDAVFDELNVPDGRGGFCWADQIRSPSALRDHWAQLREAYRRLTGRRVGRGAQSVDRVASRLGADAAQSREPLGLLVEHEPKEITG